MTVQDAPPGLHGEQLKYTGRFAGEKPNHTTLPFSILCLAPSVFRRKITLSWTKMAGHSGMAENILFGSQIEN